MKIQSTFSISHDLTPEERKILREERKEKKKEKMKK